ncbi:hypothetical protein GS399_11475 [Pedobacter sp. HMF7647]|uniref:Tetratricopeptide repeat protein n=1 Tax=Hufsiella arboris TaxID=2695275 RepID=A0A7K1YAI3_9SPHI|nr:tetratricopeptide repeat protein [Hufsiella arboris]MXV51592.1 hypothetical protein [Hufsiella arboris]
MLNTKQIVVISTVAALMAVLFFMDIKGLVKPKETRGAGMTTETASQPVSISLESISTTAKNSLSANLAQQITDLEASLKQASGSDKLKLQQQLAQKWDDVNQPAPASFYHEMVAQQVNDYPTWLKAGDEFTDAYQNTQDTLVQPGLVQKAINAYKNAQQLQPKSLDAKTGLGVAYVSGTPNPMQGIQLLLEVVKEEPRNVKANMNLGLFSMRSGQFDKAVNRFKTVNDIKPSPESWFYLASSYENMGLKDEAIAAYLKSKELAADPGLTQFVEKKIAELKK